MTSVEPKTSETSIVGQRLTRSEGHGLVTGQQHYVADLSVPGMLHVKAKLSPYANARIVSIDVSAAEAMPGVVAVITHADVPNNRHGVYVEDQPVLADKYVRYLAEPIAAVAAVDEMTAADAQPPHRVSVSRPPHLYGRAWRVPATDPCALTDVTSRG